MLRVSLEQMVYHCRSSDYLQRAEKCLQKEDPEYVFYAAFELRCFVEIRQHQYLLAAERYRKSLPDRWHIGKQHKTLKMIYSSEKKQVLTFFLETGYSFQGVFVPVSKRLKNDVERMGQLLHSQDVMIDDQRIDAIKSDLWKVFSRASECKTGNMLCPAIKRRDESEFIGEIQLEVDDSAFEKKIAHFEALPRPVSVSLSYEELLE